MAVSFLIKQPDALIEKMVAGSVRVIRASPRSRLCREATADGEKSIDQDRRAVSGTTDLKGFVKVLLTEGGKDRVFPTKVQSQKVLNELQIVSYLGPGAGGDLHIGVLWYEDLAQTTGPLLSTASSAFEPGYKYLCLRRGIIR
jgi:hypothetical protein